MAVIRDPVFVVGSPRSGTTLLYHMLLSTGRFCDLFQLSGLDPETLRRRVMQECRNAGDFLRVFMESVAASQNVERWAEKTPEHILYAAEIRRAIPGALFIHLIRDGRDVAASMGRLGYIPPLPWHRHRRAEVAGLYWEWLVRRGREIGRSLGGDYLEVRYEDLVSKPQETLEKVGAFIGCDLDLEQIQLTGIGAVAAPNTAFPDSKTPSMGRWRSVLSESEVKRLEAMIGSTLRELGYAPEGAAGSRASAAAARMRTTYHSLFQAKKWLKRRSPFNRMVRLVPLRPGYVSAGNSPSHVARARSAD